VLGAHACNPSYSESRDQGDRGSRFEARLGKYFVRPYLEITHHKERSTCLGNMRLNLIREMQIKNA
jgi:hypothetical protein